MSVYTLSDLLETGIRPDFCQVYEERIRELVNKGWIKPGQKKELTDKAKVLMQEMVSEDRWGEPLQTFRIYRGFQPEDYELDAMLGCCALNFFYQSETEKIEFEERGDTEHLSSFELALLGTKYGIERCLEAGYFEVVESPSPEKQYLHCRGEILGDMSK